MSNRDTSRIKVKFFSQTTAPTGTGPAPDPVTAGSDTYACVTDGPNWSGFARGDVETTCSNTTLDAWGNLLRTFKPGKIIDMGTMTITVDWDPLNVNGGREWAAFFDGRTGTLLIEFPAESGETKGPILNVPGYCNKFTPQGTVLSEGDGSRLTAELVWKLAGAITITAPTP